MKRPGPGGEGLNINPFAKKSVHHFLEHFGATLDRLPGIHAQFHDSFEYDGDWQSDFLEEFASQRAYRLEEQLPALAGDGPRETIRRVKSDYRDTLADLVRENLVETWVAGRTSTGSSPEIIRTARPPTGSTCTRRATSRRRRASAGCKGATRIGWC